MRRLVTSLALAAALALTTVGCATSTPASGDAAATWSYTSGDGETYTLDEVPTRIIAHAYAARALMEFGITPVAIYADGPIADDPGLQGADFDGIEVLGEEWGKIDVAAAAALDPDLIVGDFWPVEESYSGIENGVDEESKRIADLAPIVGPAQGDSIVDLLEGYADLAASLGADPDLIADARADFDAAVADFRAATADNPGLTALAISPTDDIYYVAVPEYAPELLDLQRFGLDVVVPDSPDADFPYWENVSPEEADKYQPDLLLIDDRNFESGEATLAAMPTSDSIAAYAAGQTTSWPAYWLHTYGDFATQLKRLAEVVRAADASVGS